MLTAQQPSRKRAMTLDGIFGTMEPAKHATHKKEAPELLHSVIITSVQ